MKYRILLFSSFLSSYVGMIHECRVLIILNVLKVLKRPPPLVQQQKVRNKRNNIYKDILNY